MGLKIDFHMLNVIKIMLMTTFMWIKSATWILVEECLTSTQIMKIG